MATNEKITLNVDLYDNIMTEQKATTPDAHASQAVCTTKKSQHASSRSVPSTGRETIENILDLADQKKVEAIAEGKSVVDGVGQYIVTVRGSFLGENAEFDATKHSLGVSTHRVNCCTTSSKP